MADEKFEQIKTKSVESHPRSARYVSCFISYSHSDESFAEQLYSRMRDAGINVWIAPKEIVAGHNLEEIILNAIEQYDKLLLILSKQSIESGWVIKEIKFALTHVGQKGKGVLVPISLIPYQELHSRIRQADAAQDIADEIVKLFIPNFSEFSESIEPNAFQEAVKRLLPALAYRHNLEVDLSTYIERGEQTERVCELVRNERVVTLLGPGGSGKSRLASEVCWRILNDFRDGIWMVKLRSKTKEVIDFEIARELGLVTQDIKPPRKALVDHLYDKELLLVLDNCEHVTEGCRSIVDELSAKCSRLRILITSREALVANAEHIEKVDGLSIPNESSQQSTKEFLISGAVQLFLDRAKGQTEIDLTDPNFNEVIGNICRRLDGNPLALELVAARADIYSPHEMISQLDNAMECLVDEHRDRSLLASIMVSYQLLTQPEQQLFVSLSVFEGGWTRESAHAVCRPTKSQITTDTLLERLIEKSLVKRIDKADGKHRDRYAFPEMIQQFGKKELEKQHRLNDLLQQHCVFFMHFVEGLGDEQISALYLDRDNWRSAINWSVRNGTTFPAMRIAAAVWRYWEQRGFFAEGRELLKRLLELPRSDESADAHARVLSGAGLLAYRQGDVTTAKKLFEEALANELQRQPADASRIANCHNDVGLSHMLLQNYDAATNSFHKSLEWLKNSDDLVKLGNARFNLGNVAFWNCAPLNEVESHLYQSLRLFKEAKHKVGMAYALTTLGLSKLATETTDPDLIARAISLLEKARAIREEENLMRGLAETINALGLAAVLQGDYNTASTHLLDSLTRMRQIGEKRGISESYDCCVLLAAACQQMELAVSFAGASDRLRDEINVLRPPVYDRVHQRAMAAAKEKLGEQRFKSSLNDRWEYYNENLLVDFLKSTLE